MFFMRKVVIKILLFNYLTLPKCAAAALIIAPSEPKVIDLHIASYTDYT